MANFVLVSDDENQEAIEIPTENDGGDQDGTLLLTTLVAQFPGACGIKYRSESGAFRGVRLANGCLHPPNGTWSNTIYIVNFPKETKRKGDEELFDPVPSKIKKVDRKCSDLIVLGLPWKSTENDMTEYFSQFGELVLTQVKRDPRTQQSKGFGFIRFKEYESQVQCLGSRSHSIDGRRCEVSLPNSHGERDKSSISRKIFVARCTEDLKSEDLREYFGQFGEVVDVFIPKPFRSFAFVTFADALVAENLCGQDHIIKDVSVHISSAEPRGGKEGGSNNRSRAGQGKQTNGGRDDDGNWGVGGQSRSQPENMAPELNFNNFGMNMLSSAVLAAAQAMFQGAGPQGPTGNYQLGPGFGGTRDGRGTVGTFSGGDGSQNSSSYSSWGSRPNGGGYGSSSGTSQQGGSTGGLS